MSRRTGTCFSSITDDITHNILGRLPAESFASAACVSKYWNRICSQILSRPKLVSALSLNPNLLITEKLGSRTPVITHSCGGVIGRDVVNDEVREANWRSDEFDDGSLPGIVLMVGFVPGLKVDTIPLLRRKMQEPRVALPERFITDIKSYTEAVSGSDQSPAGIIMFGNIRADIRPSLAKLGESPLFIYDGEAFIILAYINPITTLLADHALPEETVIVGDGGGCFLFRSQEHPIDSRSNLYMFDAVALVFARDRNKSPDIGEIQFHVLMSAGLIPFGPLLETASVKVESNDDTSWLSARMEGQNDILQGQSVLADLHSMVEDSSNLFIGVNKQREYSNGSQNMKMTTMDLYGVMGGENEYFVIDGVGIEPGDTFLLYHPDLETALATTDIASENLEILKADISSKINSNSMVAGNSETTGVFGGLIFSSQNRGIPFFDQHNVDSSPFYLNFPGVPLAGVFCSGEIGRGSSSSITQVEGQEQCPPHCCLHEYSTVYLVLTYIPAAHSED
ncbi:F-box/LRR-repeat protein [Quillaja saponaria]|uniref:F-box/LRR-repeat protein n=1 Tax=Quillaja saponaria TaxID=32244 RepID=A0AAD7LG81_QUISA|nr:F-box/LRR-repeat protein [Quillaja saponaria]